MRRTTRGHQQSVGVTVRRTGGRTDAWNALGGETRWVDYAHEQLGDDLFVYVHSFRRVRDRYDDRHDVLFWKPSTTGVAHHYAAGEWAEVVRAEREWPPAEVEQVPRRPRRRRT